LFIINLKESNTHFQIEYYGNYSNGIHSNSSHNLKFLQTNFKFLRQLFPTLIATSRNGRKLRWAGDLGPVHGWIVSSLKPVESEIATRLKCGWKLGTVGPGRDSSILSSPSTRGCAPLGSASVINSNTTSGNVQIKLMIGRRDIGAGIGSLDVHNLARDWAGSEGELVAGTTNSKWRSSKTIPNTGLIERLVVIASEDGRRVSTSTASILIVWTVWRRGTNSVIRSQTSSSQTSFCKSSACFSHIVFPSTGRLTTIPVPRCCTSSTGPNLGRGRSNQSC